MMNNKDECVNDCKKYLGLPPHDMYCNIVQGDFYFYKFLCTKYGAENVINTIQYLKERR